MKVFDKVFLILVIAITFANCRHYKDKDITKVISNELKSFDETRKFGPAIHQAIKDLSKIKNVTLYNDIFCQTCNLVFTHVINYRKNGANTASVQNYLKKLCYVFSDWGKVACDGYVGIEVDTALYILDNKEDLTPARICSIQFQSNECYDPDASKWTIELPPKRHHSRHRKVHHTPETPLKVLQLTDLHFDPEYKAGSNAECDLPLCCQESNGPPTKNTSAAGFWGDYRVCDIPWYSLIQLMQQVNGTKYDYVYYTGDIISHKSWATNKTSNMQSIHQVYKLLNDSFLNTTVYPILGNHEPHPTDFYSPGVVVNTTVSTQWLFDLSIKEWKQWVPKETSSTISKGGYYTVSPKKGFRIIALNSNVCYTSNIWLIYDDQDPYEQLTWLTEVLTKAEKDGEKVHILSHIPPGEPYCHMQWSIQYRKIIERFASIIVAQFNGHTHLDEIRLFPDSKNTSAIVNVAYNAGSFTTFVGLNPNYRIYEVSPSNYSVTDYHHYTYNLTEANLKPSLKTPPKWYKIYSFKQAYNLKDTSLPSLTDLASRMKKNQTLINQYFRFQNRDSPLTAGGCKTQCLKRLACEITAVDTPSIIKCEN